MTLRYSDLNQDTATVMFGENDLDKHILADISVIDSADFYNVSSDEK